MKMPAEGEFENSDSPEQMNLGGMLGVALAAIVGTTLTVWAWHFASGGSEPRPKVAASASVVHRIAVMPFRSLSGRLEDERFDQELTSAVVGMLGKNAGLETVWVAGDTDPVAVGRDLRAKLLMIGMVKPEAGGRVTVRLQLLSTKDGRQIWAGDFYGNSNDVGGLSAHISETAARYLTALLD
jgi:TolB-like protein